MHWNSILFLRGTVCPLIFEEFYKLKSQCPSVRSTRGRRGDRGPPRREKKNKTFSMARDQYRGPTCNEKKRAAGGGSTRADKKAGKNISAGVKKRRGREKNIIRAGAKKNSGVNENTTHKKTLTCSRGVFFLPTYSSQE